MHEVGDDKPRQPKLDEETQRTLRAVVLRILPSGNGCGGAAEAGCPEYVLKALETRIPPPTVGRVQRGLGFAEALARQMCGVSFAEAPAAEQDRVLRQLLLTPHPTIQRFFHRLVNLTLEGFLCDPRHGGNRGGVGWRYLGIHLDARHGSPREASCTTS